MAHTLGHQSHDGIPDEERTYNLGHVDQLREKWLQFQFLRFTLNQLNKQIRISYSTLQPGRSLTAARQDLHHALSVWNSNQTPEHIYTLLKKQFDRLEGFLDSPKKNRSRYEINEMLKAGHFLAALLRSLKQIEKLQSIKHPKKKVDHRSRFVGNL